MAIPILPDGSLDPNYDPVSGELLPDRQQHPKSFIPNHGDVYATAGADAAGESQHRHPETVDVIAEGEVDHLGGGERCAGHDV